MHDIVTLMCMEKGRVGQDELIGQLHFPINDISTNPDTKFEFQPLSSQSRIAKSTTGHIQLSIFFLPLPKKETN